jgi:hypothetical protein
MDVPQLMEVIKVCASAPKTLKVAEVLLHEPLQCGARKRSTIKRLLQGLDYATPVVSNAKRIEGVHELAHGVGV